MSHLDTRQRPRTAPPSAAPARALNTEQLVTDALRGITPAPTALPWSHRLLPAPVRTALAHRGWWTNPVPQKPSGHLQQTLAVLRKYGWCQSLDTTVTGRLCIRGAQTVLQNAGHVTPADRERAVAYMQHTLNQAGIHMAFFAWNDLPGRTFTAVENLLVSAADRARQNGE